MEWTPKWVKLPIIDFVRKVYEFKDNPDEGWNWIMEFANALMLGKSDSGCDLASRIIGEAQDFASKKSEAGRMGGIASAASRKAANTVHGHGSRLPTPSDVYDFAAAEGLDAADAYECWHVTVNERGGLTADGKPVTNWQAYIRAWCKSRANNRRNA